MIELIEFLQSRGCYVIGGVPTNWRTERSDSKSNFMEAYKTYDMVSPWTPGRYRGINEVNNFKNNYLVPDKNLSLSPQLQPHISSSKSPQFHQPIAHPYY